MHIQTLQFAQASPPCISMAIRLELSESFHMIEDDHNKLTGKPWDASRTQLLRQHGLQHCHCHREQETQGPRGDNSMSL